MQDFQSNYQKLNEEQKKAVDTFDGPIMVVAGPGTGKTQLLTLRIANIIDKTDTDPENILALTFTENAAQNMRKRLVSFIGTTGYKPKITTFHSFANEVIQTFPEKFAFQKELDQLDDLEKFRIIQEIIKNYNPQETYEEFANLSINYQISTNNYLLKPFNAPYLYQSDIISKIDSLKREYVLPEKFKDLIVEEIRIFNDEKRINPRTKKPFGKWNEHLKLIQKNIELLHIYIKYQESLKETGKYDYTDMIGFVVKAFQEEEELLAYYQERYLYIMVDEYQDTNGAQNQLIKLLGSWDNSPNILVVGDDDQSIFRFQGANVANILDFKHTYPNSEVIVLTKNYRSTQNILDISSELIENNTERLTNKIENLDKKLTSQLNFSNNKVKQEDIEQFSLIEGNEGKVKNNTVDRIAKFSKSDFEYYYLSEKIKELHSKGISYDEIAIIYPRHRDGEELLDYLIPAGIPVNVVAQNNILQEQIIIKLIRIFELINNPDSSEILSEILLIDFLELNRLDVFKLFKSNNVNLEFLIGENKENIEKTGIIETEKFIRFSEIIIELISDNANHSFVEFFDKTINKLGIIDWIKETKNIDDLNSIKTLFDFVKRRNTLERDYKLNNFLKDIEVMYEGNINLPKQKFKSAEKGVNMLTAHASKGLEFEYVFIPKFVDRTWGNKRSIDKIKLVDIDKNDDLDPNRLKDLKLQEERRLFFVAITRAKKSLYITLSDNYLNGDSYKDALPSQFLEEIITKDKLDIVDTAKYENDEFEILSLAMKSPEPINFNIQEKEYLKELVQNFKLSVTALNTYLNNPEEFLYNNLLRIPRAKTKALALGTAVHSALEYFFRKMMDGETKDLNYLLFVFEKALEKEFLGEKDFKSTLIEGTNLLKSWYEHHKENWTVPIALEHGFVGSNVYLEDIPLVAKIDKIEEITQEGVNSQKHVKLIDYKTGSAKTRGQILKPVTGGPESNLYRQLVFYKLVGQLDNKFPHHVAECELDFVKETRGKFRKEKFEIPDEDIESLKELITETMRKIKNLEF